MASFSTIDSHLHIWSNGSYLYPYAAGFQEPPLELRHCQAEDLVANQGIAGVAGALIVQPSSHGYDHSYITSVLSNPVYAGRFKGMFLMNPTLEVQDGLQLMEGMKANGFVGVRFNPNLWPAEETLSSLKGMALYQRAGELHLPVGFLLLKGLPLYFDDIVKLLRHSPDTKAVIDHWGFFLQNANIDEDSWQQLLSLAAYPQVLYAHSHKYWGKSY